MSSPDAADESAWQRELLAVARRSIEVGLQTGEPLRVDAADQPEVP